MSNLTTVLPNFVKITVFATAAIISFGALAAHHEETTKTSVEEASEMNSAADGAIPEIKEEGAEAIDDIKDMTDKTDKLEKTADLMSQ